MPAYVIADVEITDPRAYEGYKPLAIEAIKKYGGKVLARGGSVLSLEGTWKPGRVVVIEFEDAAAAHRWHSSEEYGVAKAIRQKASRSNVIVAE